MTWADDYHAKTTFGRWENALLDAYQGDEDTDEDDEGEDRMSDLASEWFVGKFRKGYDDPDPCIDLPDVALGESLRLTRTDTGWEVRRLRAYSLKVPADAMCWVDAPEQDGDRG